MSFDQLHASACAALVGQQVTASAQGRAAQPEPIFVLPPLDPLQQARIDTVAVFVAEHGLAFERALAARELNNPAYAFLRASPIAGHAAAQSALVSSALSAATGASSSSSSSSPPQLSSSAAVNATFESQYYRWRVYSLVRGDSLRRSVC